MSTFIQKWKCLTFAQHWILELPSDFFLYFLLFIFKNFGTNNFDIIFHAPLKRVYNTCCFCNAIPINARNLLTFRYFIRSFQHFTDLTIWLTFPGFYWSSRSAHSIKFLGFCRFLKTILLCLLWSWTMINNSASKECWTIFISLKLLEFLTVFICLPFFSCLFVALFEIFNCRARKRPIVSKLSKMFQ